MFDSIFGLRCFSGFTVEEIFHKSLEDGERDLKNGILGERTMGLIYDSELLVKVYAEKGIKLDIVAGDCVTTHDTAYADGYNQIMVPEIRKRLGENIISEINKEYFNLLNYKEMERRKGESSVSK